MTRSATGSHGEQLAAQYLERAGLTVLERNFRCRTGEIDLVAQDGNELVFVEVRTRVGSAFETPEDSVTLRKQRKMAECAYAYLAQHNVRGRPWRVDMIAIELERGAVKRLDHYRDALQ